MPPRSAPPSIHRGLAGPSASAGEQLAALQAARRESTRSAKSLASFTVAAKTFDARQLHRELTRAWRATRAQIKMAETAADATLSAALEELRGVLSDHRAVAASATKQIRLALAAEATEAAAAEKRRKSERDTIHARVAALRRSVEDLRRQSHGAGGSVATPVPLNAAELCARSMHEYTKFNVASLEALGHERAALETEVACEFVAQLDDGCETSTNSSTTAFDVTWYPRRDTLRLLLDVAARFERLVDAAADPPECLGAAVAVAMTRAEAAEAEIARIQHDVETVESQMTSKSDALQLSTTQVELLAHAVEYDLAGAAGQGLSFFVPETPVLELLVVAKLRRRLDQLSHRVASVRAQARDFALSCARELESLLNAALRHAAYDESMTLATEARESSAMKRRLVVADIRTKKEQQKAERQEAAAREAQSRREEEMRAASLRAEECCKAKERVAAWAQHKREVEELEQQLEAAAAASAACDAEAVARLNAERVAARRKVREEAELRQREERLAAVRRTAAHQEALERFFCCVQERLGVEISRERVQSSTVAAEARVEGRLANRNMLVALDAAGGRGSDAFVVNGFTAEQLNDQRSRVAAALALAGLSNTRYAAEVFRGMSYVGREQATTAGGVFA